MLDLLKHILQNPSDFSGDLYAAITNQAGHALIVGWGIYIWLIGVITFSEYLCKRKIFIRTPPFYTLPLAMILFWYPIFEAVQLVKYKATLADCLMDVFFVYCGALLAFYTLTKNTIKVKLFTAILTIGFISLFGISK